MSVSMNDLERELRSTAASARLAPPPRLRARTLAALHSTTRTGTIANRKSIGWAMALAASFMIASAWLAMMQSERAATSNSPSNRDIAAALSRLDISVLNRLSVPPLEVSLAAPLKSELDLMARDAERTIDRFRAQFAKLSTLDLTQDQSSEPQADPADTQMR